MIDSLAEINAAFPWFFPVFFFAFGAIVGSFLNVCIYRIPAERSIISPGSTCACGKPIKWRDNIPILSWILLRGRARCCGQRFSIRYPAIEFLTGALFFACWLQHPPVKALAGMLFVSVMICATFIDFDHMIIPDRFTIGGAVVFVALSAALPSIHGFSGRPYVVDSVHATITSTLGVLIGSGVIMWIGLLAEAVMRKEAMGLGDVKFLGAIGAFLGWQGALFSIFGGAIIGTIGFGVALIWRRVKGRPKSDEPEAETKIAFGQETAFGPMLAGGALLYFLALHPFVDAYFAAVADMLTGGLYY